MTPALRYGAAAVIGIAVGLGAAAYTVRAGALGSNVMIGPWSTGLDFGSADAGAKTRAVVALRGLLALPATEARYYNAVADDDGRPLDGRCTYRVTGGAMPAAWWSVTLYDADGYLAGAGPYSVGSAALPPAETARWTILVAPRQQPGHWLPTAGLAQFNLTLRNYLPADGGKGNPPRAVLPAITREGCA